VSVFCCHRRLLARRCLFLIIFSPQFNFVLSGTRSKEAPEWYVDTMVTDTSIFAACFVPSLIMVVLLALVSGGALVQRTTSQENRTGTTLSGRSVGATDERSIGIVPGKSLLICYRPVVIRLCKNKNPFSLRGSAYFQEILRALFGRNTTDVVDWTFDTDIAARANSYYSQTGGGKRSSSPSEELVKAIGDIRAGAVDSFDSLAMNASSLVAATSALKRARNAGRLGKGGRAMLKRATQRTAGILAMRAASAAAVTGTLDGVHGADPVVVERVCNDLKMVFTSHGAVRLRTPLLRPRPGASVESTAVGGPAEVINSRGNVLLLPEDLTAPFGKCPHRFCLQREVAIDLTICCVL